MTSGLRHAVRLYESFHQFEPRDIGDFHAEFRIPPIAMHVGTAVQMLYRSDKLNAETGEDEGCIDYVHDHGPGVKVLRPIYPGEELEGLVKPVPHWLREQIELVRLGLCLGFRYQALGFERREVDAKTTEPFPEWYTTRSGHALLIVSERRRLDVIFVGGKLRVTARGVVG